MSNQNPERYARDAARECPDLAAAATPAQLKGSEQYVLLVCAAVGELLVNEDSWVKRDSGIKDQTCNVELQVRPHVSALNKSLNSIFPIILGCVSHT